MASKHRDVLLGRLKAQGARLREVRKDLLRQQPGTTQRWFQGPDGCDLFLWYDDSHGLSQLQLTFHERVIDWSASEGLRTGRLESFRQGTPLVDRGRVVPDLAPDEETLDWARAVLSEATIDDVTLAILKRTLRRA